MCVGGVIGVQITGLYANVLFLSRHPPNVYPQKVHGVVNLCPSLKEQGLNKMVKWFPEATPTHFIQLPRTLQLKNLHSAHHLSHSTRGTSFLCLACSFGQHCAKWVEVGALVEFFELVVSMSVLGLVAKAVSLKGIKVKINVVFEGIYMA